MTGIQAGSGSGPDSLFPMEGCDPPSPQTDWRVTVQRCALCQPPYYHLSETALARFPFLLPVRLWRGKQRQEGSVWWDAGDMGSGRDWRLVIRMGEKGCRSPAVLSSMGREDLAEFFNFFNAF